MDKLPFLEDAFIGTIVDAEFKSMVYNSPFIPSDAYFITPQGAYGADLIYKKSSIEGEYWVDITTQKQAGKHFEYYKGFRFVTAYR